LDQTQIPIPDAFATLFVTMPVAMWFYDPATHLILDANEAATERYGYSHAEFTRMTIRELRPPDEIGALRDYLDDRKGTPAAPWVSGPWRHRTRDGQILFVRITSTEATYRGTPARLVTAFDVSEQVESQRALTEIDERLLVSDAILSRLASIVLVSDAAGAITYASPSVRTVLGYTPEEVLGDGWWRLAHADPAQREAEWDRARRAARSPSDVRPGAYERAVRHRDGSTRWIRWHESRGSEGTVIGVGDDVTDQKLAEDALRESEERLRTIMDQAADTFLLHRPDGTFVMVNEAACRSLGYTRAELLALRVHDVVPAVMPDQPVGPRLAALASGESMASEGEHRRKDGSTFPVEARVGWLTVGGDRLILAIARDITDRKKAEQALRDSERRYRDLVDNAPIGIYRTTPDGRILVANPALARMLGYDSPEALMTKNLEQGIAADYDREWFRARMEQEGEIQAFETTWRRADGTVFHGREHARLVRDPDGQALYYEGMIEDVTARVEAERARQEAAESYRLFIERATVGFLRLTRDGRILAAHPALVAIMGYDDEPAVCALRFPLQVCATAADHDHLFARLEEVDAVEGLESVWCRRDGAQIVARLSGRGIRADDGTLGAGEFLVEDVTARRALESQLRQAQKMEAVGQLTGGIAHDFNNILTIILANADLLATRMMDEGDPEVRRDLLELQRAGRRGADVVRKLLAFSRSEQLGFQAADLRHLVRDLARMLRLVLPETVEVVMPPPGAPVMARVDPSAVEQVLLNLTTNARDAMPRGGRLAIATSTVELSGDEPRLAGWGAKGRYALVSVSDTGTGMDERTRAHIFEPFFTTKPPGQGTGLGLAMIYGLIRQHEGYIAVESEVGRGTRFDLYLPATDAPALPRAPDGGGDAIPRGHERLLLVEDEEALRRSADRILRSFGYDVVLAADGMEALEIASGPDAHFDLIITDMVMPRMGGRALIRQLQERGITIRHLFSSGYAARDIDEAGDLDATLPLLRKPWTLSELARAVRAALDAPQP
jgi:PAS domain S-box-containing protein